MGNKTSIVQRDVLDPDDMNDFIVKDASVLDDEQLHYKCKDDNGHKMQVELCKDHMVIGYPDRERVIYYHHIERWQQTSNEYCVIMLDSEAEIKLYNISDQFLPTLYSICESIGSCVTTLAMSHPF